MATSVAEPATTARGRLPGWVRHPISMAVASAGLLWLSFPPFEWHGAVWVALIPLLLLVTDANRGRMLRLAGWLGGFVFWLLALQWILAVDPSAWLGWLAMAFALSLFWVGFLEASSLVIRRLHWPITVVAPVVWVAMEYLRAHALTGFPWYYLAHSQYRQIYWTQIADFSGSLGLSFLIVLVNAAFVEAILPFRSQTADISRSGLPAGWRQIGIASRIRLSLVLASLVGTLGYGIYRVESASFRPGPRVAMLQSQLIQQLESKTRKTPRQIYEIYLAMVAKAAQHEPRPDLIVWPETAYPDPYVVVDPLLDPAEFESQAHDIDPESIAADWAARRDANSRAFQTILERTRIPMMIGASTYHFRSPALTRYNSAVLLQSGVEPQSYHKLHLVPFGEYVPFIDVFPAILNLTPFRKDQFPNLKVGERPNWFALGPYRLAAVICFEDTIPHVVRRFFSEVPDDAQPDLIVNLTNDGWFQMTIEHEMHLAVSTFRCIENRAPMARAVNTGISAMIDGNGRIIRSLAKEVADQVLDAVTPLDDRTSLYSRWGDWLGQTTLAGTIGSIVLALITPRRWLPLAPDETLPVPT